jgi:long-subunit fatty acid transport protein
MKKILVCILTVATSYFLLSTSRLYAFMSKNDVGTTTAQFLKLGAGARATALGDAFVGIADDATAVYWNPAGLNQIEKKSVSVMHAIWFEEIFYDWASYIQPTKIGTFGVGVQYLSYGKIKETDDTGLDIGNFKPSDIAGTISYARKVSDIMLGVNVKYISSKITKTATAFAGDIGGLYKLMKDRLSVGLAVSNLGTKMKFVDEKDSLPMAVKLGGAYKIKDNWIASLDVTAPNDNALIIGGGTEYNYKLNEKITIAGRTGYNTKTKDVGGLRGLTAGIGGTYLDYSLDYAFVPFGDLGDTHRVSFGMKW